MNDPKYLTEVPFQEDRYTIESTVQKPVGKCPKCQRDLYPVESYSCPNTECPVQTKVVL